jgi:hypothetical protein
VKRLLSSLAAVALDRRHEGFALRLGDSEGIRGLPNGFHIDAGGLALIDGVPCCRKGGVVSVERLVEDLGDSTLLDWDLTGLRLSGSGI